MSHQNQKKYKCVGLLARSHGFTVMKNLLEHDLPFEFVGIFTHKLNPKSYDPSCNVRDDFQEFVDLAKNNHINLYTIDSKQEKEKLNQFAQQEEFDFLISISWRYIIPPEVFDKANVGSFNIHRGDLPKYAGAEPIKQALQNNEKNIAVASHIISEKIDQGEVLSKIFHPVNFEKQKTIDENVERLKKEITPHFVDLTMQSLNLLLRRNDEKQ